VKCNYSVSNSLCRGSSGRKCEKLVKPSVVIKSSDADRNSYWIINYFYRMCKERYHKRVARERGC